MTGFGMVDQDISIPSEVGGDLFLSLALGILLAVSTRDLGLSLILVILWLPQES